MTRYLVCAAFVCVMCGCAFRTDQDRDAFCDRLHSGGETMVQAGAGAAAIGATTGQPWIVGAASALSGVGLTLIGTAAFIKRWWPVAQGPATGEHQL